MAKKPSQHVVPKGSEWAVKKAGSTRATKVFSTQKDAISHAREISRNQETELFIHRKNGQIRDRDSHGNDPRSSKG